MGSKPVMMISLAKNIPLPFTRQACLIKPSLLNPLYLSMPTSLARWSSTTKIPSTITTAPSMMIPKSIAPIDNKLADMPFNLRQIKANNKASGIMSDTMSVVRQSAIKRNTITVTKMIPSNILCSTVCVAKFTRSSRS